MSNITKERAIARALWVLRRHFDVASSRFGTLGGNGYELDVWRQLGVPLANCWIIERDRRTARRLIASAQQAHHYVGALRDFPRAFRSVHPGGTLDVFHWDLYETMEPNARALRTVFPLIAESQSRCLLVTCADQRRNRSLEEVEVINAWWTWLLGGEAFRRLRVHLEEQGLTAQQRGFTEAEAADAATRELGAYLHLLLVMCDFRCEEDGAVAHRRSMGLAALDRTRAVAERGQSFYVGAAFAGELEPMMEFLPDELVRIVYYSHAEDAVRAGFRMRTFGMHLKRLDPPLPLHSAARLFAELIVAMPLEMVVSECSGRARTVTIPAAGRESTPEEEPEEKEKTMAEETTGGTAAPAATPSENPFERLSAEADAFAVQLARQLRNLGLPTERVTALVRQAWNQLHALSEIYQGLRAHEEALHAEARLRELLGMASGSASEPSKVVPATTPAPAATSAPASPAPAAAAVAPAELGPVESGAPMLAPADSHGINSGAMTDEQRDTLRLRLVRARAKGKETYAAERAAVVQETNLTPRTVAALIATTSGKWEVHFIRRICGAIPKGDARRALAAELHEFGFGRQGKAQKMLAPYFR